MLFLDSRSRWWCLGVINSVVDTSTNCFSLNFTNTTAGYNNLPPSSRADLEIDWHSPLTSGIANAGANGGLV